MSDLAVRSVCHQFDGHIIRTTHIVAAMAADSATSAPSPKLARYWTLRHACARLPSSSVPGWNLIETDGVHGQPVLFLRLLVA